MTDYIRRDTAIELMKKEAAEMSESFEELGGESGIYAEAYEDAANMLQDMPAADVTEVVHGQWVHSRYDNCSEQFDIVKCSRCGHEAYAAAYFVRGGNYCPNCGAKMDGGNDNVSD